MSSRMPPRYLPTLTEVVDPQALGGMGMAEPQAASTPAYERTPAPNYAGPPSTAVPDKHALAQQLIKLVKPQLEAELRNIAQELFEAQFSALLPSMHLHIEEAVREAIEQALPDPPDAAY